MPLTAFRYKALSPDGAEVSGVIEAYDEFEAVDKIKATCPIVVRITPVTHRGHHIDLNEPLWVSDKALSLVSSQFAILLTAGLPMVRTVEMVAEQTGDKLVRKILSQVAADVAAGYGLAQSLELRGKKLPVTFIETVRAGEESGTLESSFRKLQVYYDKSSKIKTKVRAALMYPAFLLALAAVVIGIVMVVLVPTMLRIFEDMGSALPWPTRVLMAIANFCQHYWPALVLAVLLAVVGLRVCGMTDGGRLRLDAFALRLPVLGKINLLKAASQFANTMSTLLAAGLPVTRSLTVTGRVMDNRVIGRKVAAAVGAVEEGRRMSDALEKESQLPRLLLEMAGVGEESGSLESTLETIGAYYDSEVETASNKALSMLEPMITVIMGVVIGFILIAIYIPMFTMYSGVG